MCTVYHKHVLHVSSCLILATCRVCSLTSLNTLTLLHIGEYCSVCTTLQDYLLHFTQLFHCFIDWFNILSRSVHRNNYSVHANSFMTLHILDCNFIIFITDNITGNCQGIACRHRHGGGERTGAYIHWYYDNRMLTIFKMSNTLNTADDSNKKNVIILVVSTYNSRILFSNNT